MYAATSTLNRTALSVWSLSLPSGDEPSPGHSRAFRFGMVESETSNYLTYSYGRLASSMLGLAMSCSSHLAILICADQTPHIRK